MLNLQHTTKKEKAPRVFRDLKDLRDVKDDADSVAWLSGIVRRGQSEPWTFRDVLNVSRARILLQNNPDNRNVSEATAAKYARDISNDAWADNGEPVIISKDGLLNDGQHRCRAVILADRAVEVVFVVGVKRDTRFTIDQGKARTAGDFLGMNGHKDAVGLAAAASFVWQHQQHGRISGQSVDRPTKGEVLAIVERLPGLAASLDYIPNKGANAVGGRAALAFCHWTFAQVAGEAAANVFMDALVVGAGLHPRDPILYTRNRLMAERGRLKTNEKCELIFRAWNAHRRRDTPRNMPILGALPVVER